MCGYLISEGSCEYIVGTPTRRWVDNMTMDLVQTKWRGVDWIALALMNAVMKFRIPRNARKLSSVCTTGGLSSSAQLHIVSWLVSYGISYFQ
jgi:hypothetical protein